ncbi:uncharacterized protein LOC122954823 isoform X1 [Acropora millepora]|uniref:uncharacterized protein LOC122954823 isoform X1 n=1 Tax=Acropora millepora TaxID=45264 RepID=UPI001CF0F3A1|nr:uncharacterized protein LOC122954823 isoform X1 [Acropora millepora]XP_044170719.1 uncharacterized protein LOC122954823 isoform X1 [Acropora millepora]
MRPLLKFSLNNTSSISCQTGEVKRMETSKHMNPLVTVIVALWRITETCCVRFKTTLHLIQVITQRKAPGINFCFKCGPVKWGLLWMWYSRNCRVDVQQAGNHKLSVVLGLI